MLARWESHFLGLLIVEGPCRFRPVGPVCSLKGEAWVTVVPHPRVNVFPIVAGLGLDMGWDMTRLNTRVTLPGACPVLT